MAVTNQDSISGGFSLPLALRFFLGSAFLIALAVGAAIVVTYIKGDQVAQHAVEHALATSSAVQKEFEENRLQQLQLKVQLIAADPGTAKYVAQAAGATSNLPGLSDNGDVDTKSIPDLIKERQSQYSFDLGIVLDAKGNVMGRSDQVEAFQESLADDPLVRPAIAKIASYSGYWRQGDKLYQAAIMPLQQDQDLVGFFLLAQSVDDELSRQVAKISGAQIAFWLPDEKEKKLALAASSFDEPVAKALREELGAQRGEILSAVESGHALSRVPLSFAGQNWVAQLTPTAAEGVGGLGAVLSLTSADQIIASYRDILHWVLLGGGVAIVIALLLSYLFAKGILRPLGAMAIAAEQAAAGNYQTQLGMRGSDELARLSRAFDSLLSDLREKSDIEGYVGNLSRFLPEPGKDEARVLPAALPTPAPARREDMVLIGMEFRQLAHGLRDETPEQSMANFSRVLSWIDSAARSYGGSARALSGGRFIVSLTGEQRFTAAFQVLAHVYDQARTATNALPATAIVSSQVLSGESRLDGRLHEALLGVAPLQLDRLLPEAAPGQILLARQTGDQLKTILGEAALTVAIGVMSGKRFYALSDSALRNQPAVALPRSSSDAATFVPKAAEPNVRQSTRNVTALDPGNVFGGRYRILSILGSGGMGVVYKAHDLELDDVVALKMLKPNAFMDAEQLDRLKSEIKLARRITHPNVLRTFDFGEIEGHPYISMEYVRGLTLRYLLNETRRIPYSAGLRIARQLCGGLCVAHEVGVLHRDIKPENLILEQNGNAKLMDFGIARPIRRAEPGHTQPGTFLGTPNYSPPEQLAGEEVDQRADIYSCGVLMCEMFCGKLPFSGSNTMEIYLAQMQQTPIKPSEHWPEIPPALEFIILKCLAKQPQDRFQSAAELVVALARLRA